MPNGYYDHSSGLPTDQSRAIAAQIRDELDLVAVGFGKIPAPYVIAGGNANYGVDTGVANAYVVAISSTVTAYTDGMLVRFKAVNSNSGASTLNVNNIGVTGLVLATGQSLPSSSFVANQIVEATYNATLSKFVLKPPSDLATVNSAAASASIATAQAVIATSQATNSTAFAAAAQASADDALAAQAAADAAALLAESARDAAVIGAGVYATEAAGRAAVADGVAFKVQGSGDVAAFEYRRTNAGASVLIATYPSSLALANVQKDLLEPNQILGHTTLPVTDGGSALDTSHYVFADPVAADGYLTSVAIFGGVSGTVKARVYERVGDVFTVVSETLLSVAPGAQQIDVYMGVTAGQYIGFAASASNVMRYGTGTAWGSGWYTAAGGFAGSSFTDATATTTLRLNVQFDLQTPTRIDALDARVGASEAALGLAATKDEIYDPAFENLASIGLTGTIAAGDGSLDGSLYALEQAALQTGTLTKFRCYATGAGTVRVVVFNRVVNTFTVVQEQTVTVALGYNDLVISLPISLGQFAGVQGNLVGSLSGVSDASGFFGGAGTTSFTDASAARTTRLLIGYGLAYLQERLSFRRPATADLPWQTMLIIGAGQSLMEGSATVSFPLSPITTAQEYDTVGFAAYDAATPALLPATVANTQRTHPILGPRGEWPGLACAASIRQALMREHNLSHSDFKSTIAVANTASDGQRIGLLGRGTTPYIAGTSKAAALSGLVTGSSGVAAVIWAQGESDGPLYNNTDPAVYLSTLKQIAAHYDIDLRAATGQTKRVPLVSYQTGSTGRGIALAQLQASMESSLVYMACPMYQFDYYDSLHINPASSRLLGAYFGEAVKRIVMGAEEFEPLRIVSAQVLGSVITLTYNKSGLALDTTLVPAQTTSGFTVKNAGGTAITISSVVVRNGNQVQLTCASAPANDWLVQYGNLTASGKAPYTGGAGNLRDSDGHNKEFDGYPLHNWAVLQDWTL